jgi:hypothetical protein
MNLRDVKGLYVPSSPHQSRRVATEGRQPLPVAWGADR